MAFVWHSTDQPKITYRLGISSGLCIGLFTTVHPDDEHAKLPTYATSRSTEGTDARRTVLVGHVIATLADNERVQDADMSVPKGPNDSVGNKVGGKTVALHSLAVLPELQKHRIGTTLMKTFIEMMQTSQNVERISLITWEELVPWYESLGFENKGHSASTYAGKTWYDLASIPLHP